MFTRASLYTCNACVQLSLQGKKRHAHSSSNLLSSSFLQTSNSSFLNLKSERSGCFPEFNRKWFSKQGNANAYKTLSSFLKSEQKKLFFENINSLPFFNPKAVIVRCLEKFMTNASFFLSAVHHNFLEFSQMKSSEKIYIQILKNVSFLSLTTFLSLFPINLNAFAVTAASSPQNSIPLKPITPFLNFPFLWVILISLGLFCMLDKKMSHASSPKIVMNPTDINKEIINNIPEFSDPYKPFWGIKNGHFDTIFAAVFRSRPAINFKREVLRMEDGGSVALDWPLSYESGERFYKKKLPPNAPQIILLPGLTGGSNDSYVCHLAQNAKNEDFGVVVFNSRGCADSPVTTPQFYSASFTEDLRQVVKHVSNKHPSSKIYAVGWSLGANILVRYLGQEKDETVLSGAVSLANPFDLVLADKNFHVGFNNFYDKRLSKSLNKIFRKHAPLFEDIKGEYDIQLVSMAKSVREFDDGLTRVSFGYSTVDEYYSDASSSKSIKDVKIPLLCIQAHDDPIAPVDGIPFKDIQENDNCLLAVTPFGGHIGWMTGNKFPIGAPWTDAPVIKYLLALESLFPNQLSQANRTDPALALGSGNGSGISDTVEV